MKCTVCKIYNREINGLCENCAGLERDSCAEREGLTKFRPYQGNDVAPKYTRVKLPVYGYCWACLERCTPDEEKWVGEKYIVDILGWGYQSFPIFYTDLSHENQEILRSTL